MPVPPNQRSSPARGTPASIAVLALPAIDSLGFPALSERQATAGCCFCRRPPTMSTCHLQRRLRDRHTATWRGRRTGMWKGLRIARWRAPRTEMSTSRHLARWRARRPARYSNCEATFVDSEWVVSARWGLPVRRSPNGCRSAASGAPQTTAFRTDVPPLVGCSGLGGDSPIRTGSWRSCLRHPRARPLLRLSARAPCCDRKGSASHRAAESAARLARR